MMEGGDGDSYQPWLFMWDIHGAVSRSCAQLCKRILLPFFFFFALRVIVSVQLCYAIYVFWSSDPRAALYSNPHISCWIQNLDFGNASNRFAARCNFFFFFKDPNLPELTHTVHSPQPCLPKKYKFISIPLLGNKKGQVLLRWFHLKQMKSAHALLVSFPDSAAAGFCHLIPSQVFV